jgi:hypothetical protein
MTTPVLQSRRTPPLAHRTLNSRAMSALRDETASLALTQTPDAAVPRRDEDWIARNIAGLGPIAPPADRPRQIVFTGFARFGFGAKGKVYAEDYFPAFTRRMAENGVDCHFVWDEDGLERHMTGKPTAIVHMMNEEKVWPYNPRIRAAEAQADFVFCSKRAANLLKEKPVTNRFLTPRGIPMPRMLAPEETGLRAFSNAAEGSGKRIIVTDSPETLDPARYNTAFIDTRVPFEGKTYYTMFRIQAVTRKVLHAYVRARDTAEKAASVHSKDTPADAGLIEMLFDLLIRPRQDEITAFTDRIGRILGPGCYACDMVVCNSTGKMFMVEAGFKFNDSPYAKYLESVADRTPCNAIFYGGEYPVRAADLFLEEWVWSSRYFTADPTGMTL